MREVDLLEAMKKCGMKKKQLEKAFEKGGGEEKIRVTAGGTWRGNKKKG